MWMYENSNGRYFAPTHYVHVNIDEKDKDTFDLELRPFNTLSENIRHVLFKTVTYGESVFVDRPVFLEMFDKANMYIVDPNGRSDKEYNDKLNELLHTIQETHNMVFEPWGNGAGAKQGMTTTPRYLARKNISTIREWAIRNGIEKELYSLPAEKLIERVKKIIGICRPFKNRPVVRFVPDRPNHEGVDYCRPGWRKAEGISNGFKGTVVTKSTFLDDESLEAMGVDMLVQFGSVKVPVSEEKFGELVKYDPSLLPEKTYSPILVTRFKKGDPEIGRDINAGMDMQLRVGIRPRLDLTDIIKIVTWQLDDEIKERYFMYKNKEDKLVLTTLGRDIFERKLDMSNSTIRWEVYNIAQGAAIDKLSSFDIDGIRGQAAPLDKLPSFAKHLIRKYDAFRFPSAAVVRGRFAPYDNKIYVEELVRKATNLDFDGDQITIVKPDRFPEECVFTPEDFGKFFKVPEKIKDVHTTDYLNAMFRTKDQGGDCGTVYNIGIVILDWMLEHGVSLRRINEIFLEIISMAEENIHRFKHNVAGDIEPITFKMMLEKYGADSESIRKNNFHFRTLRNTKFVEINMITYHPFEAIVLGSEYAYANSKSYNEAALALFKPLLKILRPGHYWDGLKDHPAQSNVEYHPAGHEVKLS